MSSPVLGGESGIAFFFPLLELDDAFGLVADVDDHVVAADFEHAAGDDLVDADRFAFVFEPLFERLVKALVDLGLHLSFGQIILSEEIAINHA